MQLLSSASTEAVRADLCAKQLIDTVPLVMQFMRRQMRRASSQQLSVPQLRTLYFINMQDRPSLSDAADFIGLSLPAMSRLVDVLVQKQLITRTACPNDRRHVRLAISPSGKAALDIAWKGTHSRLSDELRSMTAQQRGTVTAAMDILRAAFDPDVVKD